MLPALQYPQGWHASREVGAIDRVTLAGGYGRRHGDHHAGRPLTIYELVVTYGECHDRSMWATQLLAEIDGMEHAAEWLKGEAQMPKVNFVKDLSSRRWIDAGTAGYVRITPWKVHDQPITIDPTDTLIVGE